MAVRGRWPHVRGRRAALDQHCHDHAGLFRVFGVGIDRGRALNASDGARRRREHRHQPGDSRPLLPRRGSDRPPDQVRFMPRDRRPRHRAAFASPWRTIVGVVRAVPAGIVGRRLPKPGRVSAVPPGGAANRVGRDPQRAAARHHHDGRQGRGAGDRSPISRSSRSKRSPPCLANERSIYRIFATLFGVLGVDRPGAVGGRRLRRDGLRGHAAHAGNRRPHGDRRRAMGRVVAVLAKAA